MCRVPPASTTWGAGLAEEPVVDKQTVAKERVRMGTETVTEDQEVSEEVRKEQIDTNDARTTR